MEILFLSPCLAYGFVANRTQGTLIEPRIEPHVQIVADPFFLPGKIPRKYPGRIELELNRPRDTVKLPIVRAIQLSAGLLDSFFQTLQETIELELNESRDTVSVRIVQA